jgi:hypothetical protein
VETVGRSVAGSASRYNFPSDRLTVLPRYFFTANVFAPRYFFTANVFASTESPLR